MKSKFDMIFESVMRNIITEAWDRFYINNIIEVTRIVTSNFTTWEKGSSGSKILKELMTHHHMKGAEEVPGKGTRDTTLNWSLANPWMREDGFDRIFDMCRSYWFGRKKSGRSFDMQCARFFEKYEEGDTLVVADIGVFAYALYAAMNSMQKRQASNEAEMNKINADDNFKEGDPITITLTIDAGRSSEYMGSSTTHVVGHAQEWPGLKFDIANGAALKKQHLSDFPNLPQSRKDADSKFFDIIKSDVSVEFGSGLVMGDVVTFTGKINRVDKRFKTVYITRAKIDKVDSFVDVEAVMQKKKAEEEEADIKKAKDAIIAGTSQFDSMTEEERQEIRSKVKDPQSLFDIFLTDKAPSMLHGIYSFFNLFSAPSANKNLLITLYDLRDMLTTDPVTPENKAKVMAILDKYYTK